jgi:hypothetical protein
MAKNLSVADMPDGLIWRCNSSRKASIRAFRRDCGLTQDQPQYRVSSNATPYGSAQPKVETCRYRERKAISIVGEG